MSGSFCYPLPCLVWFSCHLLRVGCTDTAFRILAMSNLVDYWLLVYCSFHGCSSESRLCHSLKLRCSCQIMNVRVKIPCMTHFLFCAPRDMTVTKSLAPLSLEWERQRLGYLDAWDAAVDNGRSSYPVDFGFVKPVNYQQFEKVSKECNA